MLKLGYIWLQYRRIFGHGLKVAWYRDVVRPRILSTPPIVDTADTRCEIHVLTSAQDWLNLVWALKSFYYASGRRYALCIHEDGSLGEDRIAVLRKHFPTARIVSRTEADKRLADVLRTFPRSLKFRNSNFLALKVFDFAAYLEADCMALFDSDLLFFSVPHAYLQRIEDPAYQGNFFNSDVAKGYTVEPETVRPLIGHDLKALVNSGFGIVRRDSIRWDWIEEFLALPGILDGHFWRIEQTLFALCSSRYGVELLPAEYNVRLEAGLGGRPMRHYVGAIRHLLYSEGIAHLVKEQLIS